MEKMISKMLEICTKCVIFDVFSTKFADYENPDNIYVDPSSFLERLYTFSNNLILYNHYNPYQFNSRFVQRKINRLEGGKNLMNRINCFKLRKIRCVGK